VSGAVIQLVFIGTTEMDQALIESYLTAQLV
jgi:hypothetical protein